MAALDVVGVDLELGLGVDHGAPADDQVAAQLVCVGLLGVLAHDDAALESAVTAVGRALGMAREEGLTKVLYAKDTKRILGAGIVGVNAGELIAETVLALEMGADAEDIGLTIHPHPTLSETVFFSAEMAEGTITDMMPAKR